MTRIWDIFEITIGDLVGTVEAVSTTSGRLTIIPQMPIECETSVTGTAAVKGLGVRCIIDDVILWSLYGDGNISGTALEAYIHSAGTVVAAARGGIVHMRSALAGTGQPIGVMIGGIVDLRATLTAEGSMGPLMHGTIRASGILQGWSNLSATGTKIHSPHAAWLPLSVSGYILASSTWGAKAVYAPCALMGTGTKVSSSIARLTLKDQPLAYGAIVGQSTFTAKATTIRCVKGSFDAVGDLTGWIGEDTDMRGQIAGTSQVTGYLDEHQHMCGTLQAVSTFSGFATIAGEVNLRGICNVVSAVYQRLLASKLLQGHIVCIAGTQATLSICYPKFLVAGATIEPVIDGSVNINEF